MSSPILCLPFPHMSFLFLVRPHPCTSCHLVHKRVHRGLDQLKRKLGARGLVDMVDTLQVVGVQKEIKEDLGTHGACTVEYSVDFVRFEVNWVGRPSERPLARPW